MAKSTSVMQHIVIFKTTLQSHRDIHSIDDIFNLIFGRKNWSVALDDEDKILRVASSMPCSGIIVKILNERGFECEELPY